VLWDGFVWVEATLWGKPPIGVPVVAGSPQVLLREHLAAGPAAGGWSGELRRPIDAQLVTVVAVEQPATTQVKPDQRQVRGINPLKTEQGGNLPRLGRGRVG